MTQCVVRLIVRVVGFHEMPTGPVTVQDVPAMIHSMVAKARLAVTLCLISLSGSPMALAVENHHCALKRMTVVHTHHAVHLLLELTCLIVQSDFQTIDELLASTSLARSRVKFLEDPVLVVMIRWALI